MKQIQALLEKATTFWQKTKAFWNNWKKWVWSLVASVCIILFFDSVCRRMNRPKTFRERVEQHLKFSGAHEQLEAYIKKTMNDPGSYEHVETRYIMPADSTFNSAVYITTFRGKNAFGGVVRQTVRARCNIETGKVESVISE